MRFLRPLPSAVSSVSVASLCALVAACSSTPSTGASGTSGSSGQTGTSATTGTSGAQTSGHSTGATGTTGSGTGTGSGAASGQSGSGSGVSGTTGTASGASGSSGSASGGSGTGGPSGAASGVSGTSGTQSGTSGTQSGSSGANDGGAGDSGPAGGCGGLALCDDFESDTAGSAPSTTLWSSYTGMASADSITVDSTQHHSGTKSVKVVSGGSDAWGPLFTNTNAFSSASSSLGSAVYGRFWVYLNAALPATHHAFMTLGLSAAEADPTKQMKGIEATCQSPSGAGLLTWNYNDSLLPDVYNFKSQTIPAQTWTCFEFHTDAASGDIEVWLNGARLDTMSLPNDAGAKWTGTAPPNPLKVYGMGLGWMAFNGVAMTLWFDDVALSTSRIGCN